MHSSCASEDMIAVNFPTMLSNFNYQKSNSVDKPMPSISKKCTNHGYQYWNYRETSTGYVQGFLNDVFLCSLLHM